MRTVGTFSDIYKQARAYYHGGTTYGGQPLDPVVRREDGVWVIESKLSPSPDADFECSLDSFDTFFYEAYLGDDRWSPSETDMEEFVKIMTGQ